MTTCRHAVHPLGRQAAARHLETGRILPETRHGHRLKRIAAAAIALLGVAAAPVRAETEVDLELVLAVDISRSMDYDEQLLQRSGYVEAIKHPEVMAAIRGGLLGRIAVTYFEWAGPGQDRVAVPWQIIEDEASAADFADKVAGATIGTASGTSISAGLLAAAALFETSGYRSYRQVIDVSGDGPNNRGGPVAPARDAVVAKGIVINGLPIMLKAPGYSPYSIPNLDAYYQQCVIGGPGSFIVPVQGPDQLVAAVRRKLVLEIAAATPTAIPAQMLFEETRTVDCMIGEQLWRRYMDP